MKKYLFILLLSGFIFPCTAQTPDAHIDRRIYLWDVTMSMQGYDSHAENNYDPDIDVWDKVVTFLKRDIDDISDPYAKLILLPFQEDILDYWEVKATDQGKDELKRKIDESKKRFQNITYTNIVRPFSCAKEKYVDPKCRNLVILITDGHHSEKFGGKKPWLDLLSSWEKYADENGAYLIYCMVGKAAQDNEIVNIVDNKGHSDLVLLSDRIPKFIDLYPTKSVNFNIKDDHETGVYIEFDKSKRAIALARGIRVAVKSSADAKIAIEQTAEIEDNKILLKLPYSWTELKSILNEEEKIHIPLILEIQNQYEIQQKHGQKIFLRRNTVDLVLINKIEKILKIKIKKGITR